MKKQALITRWSGQYQWHDATNSVDWGELWPTKDLAIKEAEEAGYEVVGRVSSAPLLPPEQSARKGA